MTSALAPVEPGRAVKLARDKVLPEDRAAALATVAAALAERDPARAAQAVAQARDVADAIGDVWKRRRVLEAVAALVVAADPGYAEMVAQQRHDDHRKVAALTAVAQLVADRDQEHAARLVAQAQRIAEQLEDGPDRAAALVGVARALARRDPDRAEDIARAAGQRSGTAVVLAEISAAVAAGDRDRAERLAVDAVEAAAGSKPRLIEMIQLVAAGDPEVARTVAERVPDEPAHSAALATALVVLAGPPTSAAPHRRAARRAFGNR